MGAYDYGVFLPENFSNSLHLPCFDCVFRTRRRLELGILGQFVVRLEQATTAILRTEQISVGQAEPVPV